jgi:hypothetical protein
MLHSASRCFLSENRQLSIFGVGQITYGDDIRKYLCEIETQLENVLG